MIAADVISYVVSAVISFWIVYGITEFSSPLLAIAVAAVLVAIFGALGIWTVRLDRVLNGVDSDCGGTEIHVCRHRHRHQQWSSGLRPRFQKQVSQAALYLSPVCKGNGLQKFPRVFARAVAGVDDRAIAVYRRKSQMTPAIRSLPSSRSRSGKTERRPAYCTACRITQQQITEARLQR